MYVLIDGTEFVPKNTHIKDPVTEYLADEEQRKFFVPFRAMEIKVFHQIKKFEYHYDSDELVLDRCVHKDDHIIIKGNSK